MLKVTPSDKQLIADPLVANQEVQFVRALYKSIVLTVLCLVVGLILLRLPAPKVDEGDPEATDVADSLETTPETLPEYSRHFRQLDRTNIQKVRIACRQLFAEVEDGRLKPGPGFERAWLEARKELSAGQAELEKWDPPTPFVEARGELQESFPVLEASLDTLQLSVRSSNATKKTKLFRQAQQKLSRGLALSRQGERDTTDLLGVSSSPRI